MNTSEEFWANVEKIGLCWKWRGGTGGHGYGTLKWKGTTIAAHRISYRLMVGEIPKEMELDHLCRNRLCVNPFHLEPVTPGENILRGFGRGAIEARQVKCIRGHKLEGENLIIRKDGHRQCRECKNTKARDYYSRHKEYWIEWRRRRRIP